MNILFHPDAELEFNKAIDYYEAIENGLGYDFSLEIVSTIARIVDFPKAWLILEGEIRRALVRRFPYGI
ncbi:MAG: type II toxin-antitoxin system RelE/ParE family toxin [Methylobacter sp.]|nr:type II toxin-antitoxin system RelE/ParE family toxin [Methylobacter sp.]